MGLPAAVHPSPPPALALGIVIISQIATSTDLMHILFGNVLGVRYPALVLTLSAGGSHWAPVDFSSWRFCSRPGRDLVRRWWTRNRARMTV